jgi:hypothetical protein
MVESRWRFQQFEPLIVSFGLITKIAAESFIVVPKYICARVGALNMRPIVLRPFERAQSHFAGCARTAEYPAVQAERRSFQGIS